MAEGLFKIRECQHWFTEEDRYNLDAVVKIYPNRKLEFHIISPDTELFESVIAADGSEIIKIGITLEELHSTGNPDFELALFKYEAIKHYRNGGNFPALLDVEGCASAFFAFQQNILFSSYHVVSSAVHTAISRRLKSGHDYLDCPGIIIKNSDDILVSSCPRLIYWPDYNQIKQGLDFAIFHLEDRKGPFYKISNNYDLNETVYMAGYPMRTARNEQHIKSLGYSNANYDRRISRGNILKIEGRQIISDCDGGPGNSGSPLINEQGKVIALYKGSIGSGISDYKDVLRSHLSLRFFFKFFD